MKIKKKYVKYSKNIKIFIFFKKILNFCHVLEIFMTNKDMIGDRRKYEI